MTTLRAPFDLTEIQPRTRDDAHTAFIAACANLGAVGFDYQQGQATWADVSNATKHRADTWEVLKRFDREQPMA